MSIGVWSHQPRRGPAHAAHPSAAAQRVPGFSLPPATVAWVDYSGRLHIGDVATLAQRVAGTIPAWAGAGWLGPGRRPDLRGRLAAHQGMGPRDTQNPAPRARVGVFPSADGRHAYVERTSTSLAELRASGRGVLRRLHTPAGWYLLPNAAGEVKAGVGGGGILVSSRPGGPSRSPRNLATWDPATGKVTLVARSAAAVGAYTPPGGRYSLIAWAPAPCMSGNCPIEITNTATRATVTARSPLPYGFTGQGAAFSPHGTRLAVFERTASIDSPCCASNSVLATVNTRTGAVRAVRAARLVDGRGRRLDPVASRREAAARRSAVLQLCGGHHHARGPAVLLLPQTADAPDADHNIMDTPDSQLLGRSAAIGRCQAGGQRRAGLGGACPGQGRAAVTMTIAPLRCWGLTRPRRIG